MELPKGLTILENQDSYARVGYPTLKNLEIQCKRSSKGFVELKSGKLTARCLPDELFNLFQIIITGVATARQLQRDCYSPRIKPVLATSSSFGHAAPKNRLAELIIEPCAHRNSTNPTILNFTGKLTSGAIERGDSPQNRLVLYQNATRPLKSIVQYFDHNLLDESIVTKVCNFYYAQRQALESAITFLTTEDPHVHSVYFSSEYPTHAIVTLAKDNKTLSAPLDLNWMEIFNPTENDIRLPIFSYSSPNLKACKFGARLHLDKDNGMKFLYALGKSLAKKSIQLADYGWKSSPKYLANLTWANALQSKLEILSSSALEESMDTELDLL